jgi:DNA-directed RNA polymerase specialized sigma24 family protein
MADPPSAARFPTTRWSRIAAAGERATPEAREALAELCAAYWYPLYAFVRRKGHDPETARDLVQGFFANLLQRGDLAGVEPARGRFRSFLMAACAHYLSNQHDRDRALKRGGGQPIISLDAPDAEGRYRRAPAHGMTAERLYQRSWATTLLGRVLERLEAEQAAAGKARAFAVLSPALLGSAERLSYARAAAALGITEAAARAAAGRLRVRYRALLQAEVGGTVDDEAAVDEEIRDLFAAFGD